LALTSLFHAVLYSNSDVEAIEAMALANRKIGLGVLGFAELLLRLWAAYCGEKAVAFARQFIRFIQDEVCDTSAVSAGHTFIMDGHNNQQQG
jgi:ribonucleoside-diphosphate reductase alpha chain